ncbi:MAG: recombinase family protein [Candidatus Methanomethylophilaceae archaeon]|nr:recombinase family protein [Candidatus Methanomethylophilaceae archaeon]MBR4225562.1 recombinase family protein [Candidatus Methanomethylophilaceae archaeon]
MNPPAAKTEKEAYTAVLYARVSTDDKDQTNDTQIRQLRQYCDSKGWVVLDVYTDEMTGKNVSRPGFRSLKGRITERDVDYVVARNQDRISREPSDYQDFVEFCKTYRVRIRYCDNGATPETVDGVILDSVQAGLAKADNMKRSSTTKAGMETARLRGVHCGRMMAFCWSDEVGANRHRIQTEGPHRTVIQSSDTVLDIARQGMTVSAAARIIGVNRTTLSRALRARGLAEEYDRIRRESRSQGMAHTTVPDDGETALTREGGA